VLTFFTATGEPEGLLHRQEEGYGLGAEGTARINATLLSLVRNEEVDGMVQAMRDLERTWNHKFNYPWTFFNDVPFSEEFKKKTQAETKAVCNYGKIICVFKYVLTDLSQNLFLRSIGMCRRGSMIICLRNPRGFLRKMTFSMAP